MKLHDMLLLIGFFLLTVSAYLHSHILGLAVAGFFCILLAILRAIAYVDKAKKGGENN